MWPLYIIGFMGAGKTTVGQKLSQDMHVPVFDTDQMVEQAEGKTISEIFAEKGEVYFRDKESETLFHTKNTKGIITTGGGIILRKENRDFIRTTGTSIFLKCNIEKIMERIQYDTTRPLVANKSLEEVDVLYWSRKQFYENTAKVTIDTTHLTIEETVNEIMRRIK
ncbi:MAG: shikimate kinase [Heyndrickxia sp.]